MSHSELAITGLYDHEQETEPSAPDWGGDDLFTHGPRRRRFERGDHPAERAEPARLRQPARPAAPRAPVLAPSRRTVTVTGHPGEGAAALRSRRPGRSIDERLSARPERIAAWAFAMGLLLILIALLSAQS